LQAKLDQAGKVNALFVRSPTGDLREALRQALAPDDYGLAVRDPASRTASLFAKLKRRGGDRPRPTPTAAWKDVLALTVGAKMDADHNDAITPQEVSAYYQSRGVLSVESRQLLIEPALADAVLATAKDLGWPAAPTLVYLANRITEGDASLPYSVVAASDF